MKEAEPNPPPGRSSRAAGLTVLLALALTTIALLRPLPLPEPAPLNAPATEFSARRALAHVQAVARAPHPLGSENHTRVRDYLLEQLQGLGLEARVQETTAASAFDSRSGHNVWAARVRNVLARLPGSDSSGAVLLVTHYDSTPSSPGAADSGAAVAAILETLRALGQGAPLRNDLIVLFTDAEENRLFGAQAFVQDHPWAADVGVVLNFDARGAGGPSLLFETGPGNGWLLRQFAEAAPYPVGTSFAATVYKYMPNGTDFSLFRERRFRGLNFAFIERPTVYHTAADSIGNLDLGTVQQLGSNCLGLARRFGSLDLAVQPEGDAVFFNLFGGRMVVYSTGWALPLALLTAAAFGVALALGLRRGRLTRAGLARGLLAFLISLLAVPLTAAAALWAVFQLDPSFRWLAPGATYNSPLYFAAFSALAVAVAAAVYALFARRTGLLDATMGALLLGVLLQLLTAWLLPGGSYLLTWPVLFATLGSGAVLAGPREPAPAKAIAALGLGSLPAVWLLVPWIDLLFVGLSVLLAWAVVLFVALLMGLLVPHLYLLTGRRRWWVPATCAMLALAGFGIAIASPGFDTEHPRPNSIFYALDAETRQARWASLDEDPDPWTSQFLGRAPRREGLQPFTGNASRRYLQAPAPAMALAPPDIVPLPAAGRPGGQGALRFQVRSPRGGSAVRIDFPKGLKVGAVRVDGRRVEDPGGTGSLDRLLYFGPAPGGFELELELPEPRPVVLNVVDYSFALPGLPFEPRPPGLIPKPMLLSEMTLVRKGFSLDAATLAGSAGSPPNVGSQKVEVHP